MVIVTFEESATNEWLVFVGGKRTAALVRSRDPASHLRRGLPTYVQPSLCWSCEGSTAQIPDSATLAQAKRIVRASFAPKPVLVPHRGERYSFKVLNGHVHVGYLQKQEGAWQAYDLDHSLWDDKTAGMKTRIGCARSLCWLDSLKRP